ncbi:MAG TPA: PilW family protein [Thiohalobacter sp.]|nr:PilW family protein [Thiohalobacter sp.]
MNRTYAHHSRQAGVTLVELMVAMTVSLILLAGVLQIFQANRQSYRVQEALARTQENGRFAIEFLTRDIRMADFWGCTNTIGKLNNNLDSTSANFIDFAAGGLDGTEGATALAPDSLVLRSATGNGMDVTPPTSASASSTDDVLVPGNNLQEGDIILVSDCESADIAQVTGNPGSGSVPHASGTAHQPGNCATASAGCPGNLSKVYREGSRVFRARSVTYDIRNNTTTGEPGLWRTIDGGAAQELVDGIENLQILYGEDTDDDQTADRYVDAGNVGDMENVVSVRVAVVSRSYTDNLTGGTAQNYNIFGTQQTPTDNRLRQVYTATIGVRNRLN